MVDSSVKEIDDLVKIISKLPALGPKSARRIVLKLINNREELLKNLTNSLAQAYKNLRKCNTCGCYFSVNSDCVCSKKNYNQIVVVQSIADKWTIEDSGIYKSGFHVLGGTLPSFESKKKDRLLISSLIDRVKNNSRVKEIILACGNTTEGNITSHLIIESLKDIKVKITRLGRGISVGQEVFELGDGTLVDAFKNRSSIASD